MDVSHMWVAGAEEKEDQGQCARRRDGPSQSVARARDALRVSSTHTATLVLHTPRGAYESTDGSIDNSNTRAAR